MTRLVDRRTIERLPLESTGTALLVDQQAGRSFGRTEGGGGALEYEAQKRQRLISLKSRHGTIGS